MCLPSMFFRLLKRCFREHRIQTLYFFDEWDKKGTEENEIPVENIKGDILFLTSTHDESVPAKRDAELLTARLKRCGFAYHSGMSIPKRAATIWDIFRLTTSFFPGKSISPRNASRQEKKRWH